ncbi:ElyC/SanA/YdcF family protein [Pseudoclavibacter soli]|uniref:ElyC/SanA/YdcF family protein n=1 Tax=Pseudoclavibacter soli TaxID=452623 RepID=UPI0003F5FAE7|nr:ElyC/SanA/YdcF family protein [Pseudoclavibacter soli]
MLFPRRTSHLASLTIWTRPVRAARFAAAIAAAATLLAGLQAPAFADANQASDTLESSTAIQALVSAVDSNQPNSGGKESVANLADQNSSTKWYEGSGAAPSAQAPIYAVYTLSRPASAIGYTLTSGNDESKRDPKTWQLLGTNDAVVAADAASDQWQVLDSRADESFSQRAQTNGYSIANPANYTYYQLRVTANEGNTNQFQIADFTLLGSTGTARELVGASAEWSYWDTTDSSDTASDPTAGSDARTSWSATDAVLRTGWKTGVGPFGVKKQSDGSDGADLGNGFSASTVLQRAQGSSIVPAYFFRTQFSLTQGDLGTVGGLVGTIAFDDTATVYVNGQRVTGWDDADVTSNTAALKYDGKGDPQTRLFTVPAGLLTVGTNTIAVEVHQCNQSSSDAWFAMPTLVATADYTSLSYTGSERDRSYSSDSWPATADGSDGFVSLLSGYSDLADQSTVWGGNSVLPKDAELTARNDQLIVQINNEATDEQVSRAITDANNSPVQTEYDGLGERLGSLYKTALNTGQLPKTAEVLSHLITDDIDGHNTAKSIFTEKRPYERLGFTSDGGRIQKYDIGYGFSNDSFPSGHTTGGYMVGTTLATLLPELAPQMLERASEYGNNRIVLGFHYPIDVMGGRIGGQAMVGYRWSDSDFRQLLLAAHDEIESVLTAACVDAGYGSTLTECASDANDTSSAVNTYTERLTYGFSSSAAAVTGNADLVVPTGAADLLLTSYPQLTQAQRAAIIRQTALSAGYPLDLTARGEASWQRVNLAAALTAEVQVISADQLSINGVTVDVTQVDDGDDGASTETDQKAQDATVGSLIEYQRLGLSADVDEAVASLAETDAQKAQAWSEIAQAWTDDLYRFDPQGSDDATSLEGIPDGLPNARSQVFVVLGNKLNDDGSAKQELIDRLEVARAALTKYPNTRVLVTGGHTAGSDKDSEGEVMQKWLIAHGIAADRILVETESSDTPDNATMSMPMLYGQTGDDAVTTISVITSQWHQRRGTILFEAETRLLADALGVQPITVLDGATCATSSCTNSSYATPPAFVGDDERDLIARNVAKVASNMTVHSGLGTARGVSDAYSAARATTDQASTDLSRVIWMQSNGYTGDTSTARDNLLDVRRAIADTAASSRTYGDELQRFTETWDAALAPQRVSDEIPDDLPTAAHAFVLMGADGGGSTAMKNRIALAKNALAEYPNSIVLVAGNQGEITAGYQGLTTGDDAVDASRIVKVAVSTDAPSGAVNVMRQLYSMNGAVTSYTVIVSGNYVRRPTVLFAAAELQQRQAQRADFAISSTEMIAETSTGTPDAAVATSDALGKIATNVAQVFGVSSAYSSRNSENTPLSALTGLSIVLPNDARLSRSAVTPLAAQQPRVYAELDNGAEGSVEVTDLVELVTSSEEVPEGTKTTWSTSFTYRGITKEASASKITAADSGTDDGSAENGGEANGAGTGTENGHETDSGGATDDAQDTSINTSAAEQSDAAELSVAEEHDGLASTGGVSFVAAGSALALLALGAGVLVVARRRAE